MFASLAPTSVLHPSRDLFGPSKDQDRTAFNQNTQPLQYLKIRQEYVLASGFIYIGHDRPGGYIVLAVE